MDASALQNVQGGCQAEYAHGQHSNLEGGQADVLQASTFSARGDCASAIFNRLRVGWDEVPVSFRPDIGRIVRDERKRPVATWEGVYPVLVCMAL